LQATLNSDRQLRQRRFLKMVEKLSPQIIERLDAGSAICVARLGHKRLSDGRVMELRIEGRIKDTASPDVSRLHSGSKMCGRAVTTNVTLG
jgi:hypothetical protein